MSLEAIRKQLRMSGYEIVSKEDVEKIKKYDEVIIKDITYQDVWEVIIQNRKLEKEIQQLKKQIVKSSEYLRNVISTQDKVIKQLKEEKNNAITTIHNRCAEKLKLEQDSKTNAEIVEKIRELLKDAQKKRRSFTPDNWNNISHIELTQYELQVILTNVIDKELQSILKDSDKI